MIIRRTMSDFHELLKTKDFLSLELFGGIKQPNSNFKKINFTFSSESISDKSDSVSQKSNEEIIESNSDNFS